jgi:hypothetical protein
MEKGMAQGLAQGVGKGQARLLQLLIERRFGAVPPEVDARLQAAPPEQLEVWALRVLDSTSLDDVFGQAGGH